MTKRIQDFQQALSPTPAAAPGQPQQQQQQPGQLSQLPRITAPLKQDNIFTAPPPPRSRYEKAEHQLSLTTKAAAQALVQPPPNGQPPPDPLKPLREPAMKLIGQGANSMFSQETQQTIVHPVAPINSVFTKYLLTILQSPVGIPFRETLPKHATAIVLGAPYGANTPLLAAISALSQLAISSLKEDEYGTVSKDVASIIRTFTYAESAVVRFMSTLQPHWTDVGFDEKRPSARVVEDVEAVLAELRNGLSKLVSEFAEYQEDLGLTAMDIREAKAAVMRGKSQENEKTGGKQGEGEQMAERKRDETIQQRRAGRDRSAGQGKERR
jgi:nucleoporin NDC1